MAKTPARKRQLGKFTPLLLLLIPTAVGDLEPTLGRCCAFGANWAREGQQCATFPAPVLGISTEHQSVCLTAAGICCLRYFRDEQCQKGRQAAQVGQDCVSATGQGGEYYKDCCQGCKLGLVSGSMGMRCSIQLMFGFPWDNMYVQCCNQAARTSSSPSLDFTSEAGVARGNLYPGVTSPAVVPDGEDLCARFPGKLCAHVCVPTPGSYRCQCRAGFTLSVDGKTCIQEAATDRCQVNNPCAHKCRDTGISIECSCNPGYTLAANQRSCEDVDECSSGSQECVAGEQVCYNQPGSYSCINADGSLSSPGSSSVSAPGTGYEFSNEVDPSFSAVGQGFPDSSSAQGRCPLGYNFNLETRTCDDVDECEVIPGLCGQGGMCQNTIGSYTCTHSPISECPPGFTFDLSLQSCLDVDECIDGSNNCNWTTHFCVNTQGGYTCQKKGGPTDCVAGYKFSVQQQTCIDVDECEEGLDTCNPAEENCRNTAGAYECDIKCDQGFQFSPVLASCVDLDECAEMPCEAGWECHNTAGSYMCHQLPRAFCPAGYKPANATGSGCEDVDECEEDLHSCRPDAEVCVNEIGKYRCQVMGQQGPHTSLSHSAFQPQFQECPNGFGFDPSTIQCLDIDECSGELHDCTPGEQCINTLGSFLCQPHHRCPAGFAPDPNTGHCQDIDECDSGIGGASCLPGQICHNTRGAFECRVECQDGFRYDPTDEAVCVDVDECQGYPCAANQHCTNTEGSYVCTTDVTTTLPPTTTTTTSTTTTTTTTTTSRPPSACPPGFGRNPNSFLCEDIDECRNRVCEGGQRCTNTPGFYICSWPSCDQGYTRHPHTNQCQDTDECEEGLHRCRPGVERCINTPGGHVCQPRPCSPGYRRHPDHPTHCADIDECDSSPCSSGENCVNTEGSYTCRQPESCQPGFRKDQESQQCQDIDECVEEAPCGRDERCVNTRGSYRCRNLDCNPGYASDPWGHCKDIDECETGEHNCRVPGEECVNTPGSYRCKPLPPCPQGFKRHPDTLRCVDRDECSEGSHDCKGGERCLNQYGRYACQAASPRSCHPGYRYASINRRCVDIDECTEKVDSCDWTSQMCINSMGSFRCVDRHPVCDFGYQFDQDKRSCVDVDECGESRPVCQDRQLCVNTLGSYQCRTHGVTTVTCQPGFTFNTTARACIDIDECSEGSHDCTSLETCVNHHGDYTCEAVHSATNEVLNSTAYSQEDHEGSRDYEVVVAAKRPGGGKRGRCQGGYRYNRRRRACLDIDECGSDPCGEGELCRNTQGSYLCQCLPGYSKEEEEEECVDVNECQVDVHSCTENQRCDNTIGSFVCIRIAGCGTGYTLNHNSGQCDDNNECKLNTHNCGQLGPKYHCVNIRGSFRCKRKICPLNHVLSEEGTCSNLTCSIGYMPLNSVCIDVNECVVGGASSPCQRNERCINTIGSYLCRPLLNCGAGYHMNDVGTQCVDIDECQEGTHQCEGTQMCSNRQGGYICQCPSGYRLNHQRQCQDINECESYYGSACSSNAVCVNSPGSFHCNCKGGFKESSSGRSCVDIDECFEVEGMCHHNCINVWGSHQCTCRAGYSLASDNRTCDDIDECEEVRGRGRLCIGNCVNNPGSFSCSCPDGYSLAADGRTCKDINECESGNVCRESSEHCVNTRGGYKCNVISCPQNYIKDTRHKNRCKKETSYCLPGDEACQQQPLSYSFNYLPLVSNLSLPSQGQIDLFTMRGPLWASTTVEFSLELEKATASPGLQPATRDFFYLKRTSFNQAVISLVRPVVGPQEVQLALNMKLYQQGKYSGSAVAKLVIYVSQYDF